MKIKLAKAVRLDFLRKAGETVDVSEAQAERLKALGVAELVEDSVQEDTTEVSEGAEDQAESDEPVEDEPQETEEPEGEAVEETPEGTEEETESERPLRSAPVAEWKAYAEKIGLKVAGLKRNEIIGAVEAHEGE